MRSEAEREGEGDVEREGKGEIEGEGKGEDEVEGEGDVEVAVEVEGDVEVEVEASRRRGHPRHRRGPRLPNELPQRRDHLVDPIHPRGLDSADVPERLGDQDAALDLRHAPERGA
ncbi:MAG: hypothetical protein ACK5U8_06965, partial [Deltaproteobacteria bacterium]